MLVDKDKAKTSSVAHRPMRACLIVGMSSLISYLILSRLDWHGGPTLHTVMETVATLLSLLIGVMVLVRFYSKKNNTFLFVGAGFLGTAFLDGYHTIVTSEYFQPFMPSELPALIPWSWVASRQFLSMFLFLSWLAWYREQKLARRGNIRGNINERTVYLFAVVFTLTSFAFFAYAPLPTAYYPDFVFHRLEEFLPAAFFFLAFLGYLHKGKWKHDQFENWLVVSLFIGFIGQAVFMSQSGRLFDLEFDIAHILKNVSYLCVLVGLLANTYAIFRQEEKRYSALLDARKETDQALSELASHKMALDVHASVAVTDARGTITYANDQFCKISKYEREELIGKNHRILKSDHHPDSFFANMYQTISNGKTWHGEIKNLAKDGSAYWVSTTIIPYKNTDGKITQYIAIRTDVTGRKTAEAVLQTNLDILNTTFDNFPGGISVFTKDLLLKTANPAYYRIMGLPEEKFGTGSRFEDIIRFVAERGDQGDADIDEIVRDRVEMVSQPEVHVIKRTGPNGTRLEIKGWPLPEGGFIATYMDITEAENTLDALEAKSQEALNLAEEARVAREIQIDALQNMLEGFALWDNQDKLIMCNQSFKLIFRGIDDLIVPGMAYETLVREAYKNNIYQTTDDDLHKLVLERVAKLRRSTHSFEEKLADGRWVRVSEREASDDRVVAIIEDISERKTAELALQHMAQNDALTGLPNRNLFHERLKSALDNAARTGMKVGVMLLDLDHFKSINDTLGHPAGDALLCEVANRLLECARQTDTVARLGGDEFAIIATNLKDALDIDHFACRIGETLAEPFILEGQKIHSGGSIGITIYPEDDGNSDELLRSADIALYKAKEAGRGGYKLFDSKMDKEINERKVIEQDLWQAIEQDQFELYYQPQVDLNSSRIIGAEALLRWRHPERGIVSPAEFIPVAEATRLILPIGEWVANEACRQAKEWQEQGLSPIVVSINQSTLQFQHQDMLQVIRTALKQSQLAPHWLELEVTEGIAMEAGSCVKFEALKKIGVRLAIDDFGSGYSSLSLLKDYPVDRLKIDKSFVRSVDTVIGAKAICSAIVNLGKNLGLRVIAEGVETLHELETVQEIGCDEIQGFGYAPPLPAKAFAALLRASDPKSNNNIKAKFSENTDTSQAQ